MTGLCKWVSKYYVFSTLIRLKHITNLALYLAMYLYMIMIVFLSLLSDLLKMAPAKLHLLKFPAKFCYKNPIVINEKVCSLSVSIVHNFL